MFSLDYHETTKHHFNRFARSAGHLDWATQPDPFRRYAGARAVVLPRQPVAPSVPYSALFGSNVPPSAVDENNVGEFLRCSMGLSAWKQYQSARWPLRVNPSSGNLHPTEAYIVWGGRICHYAPRDHALEERGVLQARLPDALPEQREWWSRNDDAFLVGLASIYWREAWKYGERAFRYCQHDIGHAIGAMRFAAARLGWRMALLPRWSDPQVATLLGLDRDADFDNAEREAPECLAVVTRGDPGRHLTADPGPLVDAATRAAWHGAANRLSGGHVEWEIIERIAAATEYQGSGVQVPGSAFEEPAPEPEPEHEPEHEPGPRTPEPGTSWSRSVILQRRSATAFDGRSSLPVHAFFSMLARLIPTGPPWDVVGWPPQVHLALFVHRVDGLTPGLYAFLRDRSVLDEWRAVMRPEFLWEPRMDSMRPTDAASLFLLVPVDTQWPATRISCDQDIAGQGFFSLGMVARLEPALRERGESFYRRLFWECGLIGQVLYLEAEAAGARSTGIGCFYDDAVHDVLGLSGHAWQSLYHFSMGMPVEDARLTTEPGYEWERNVIR